MENQGLYELQVTEATYDPGEGVDRLKVISGGYPYFVRAYQGQYKKGDTVTVRPRWTTSNLRPDGFEIPGGPPVHDRYSMPPARALQPPRNPIR